MATAKGVYFFLRDHASLVLVSAILQKVISA